MLSGISVRGLLKEFIASMYSFVISFRKLSKYPDNKTMQAQLIALVIGSWLGLRASGMDREEATLSMTLKEFRKSSVAMKLFLDVIYLFWSYDVFE